MGDLPPHHAHVGRNYDRSGSATSGYDYEAVRLDRGSVVEYAITKRYLDCYLTTGATVADIGVGVGHYSEVLARRGCRIHLIDVSQRLLDTTIARLTAARMEGQIASVHHASATDLSFLPDGCCDAVLLLGPLYHLGDPTERRCAIAEAARILRVGGLLFAAGINHLAYFRDTFWKNPAGAAVRSAFHQGILQDGNFDPPLENSPPTVHLTTAEAFRAEFTPPFAPVILAGVESFASPFQESLLQVNDADAVAWLDLVEQTGVTPEGLGVADHFLYIGRRDETT